MIKLKYFEKGTPHPPNAQGSYAPKTDEEWVRAAKESLHYKGAVVCSVSRC